MLRTVWNAPIVQNINSFNYQQMLQTDWNRLSVQNINSFNCQQMLQTVWNRPIERINKFTQNIPCSPAYEMDIGIVCAILGLNMPLIDKALIFMCEQKSWLLKLQFSHTEKTMFPFTLNGIWSWWQFSFRFWTRWNFIWFRISKGKLSYHIPFNVKGNIVFSV